MSQIFRHRTMSMSDIGQSVCAPPGIRRRLDRVSEVKKPEHAQARPRRVNVGVGQMDAFMKEKTALYMESARLLGLVK